MTDSSSSPVTREMLAQVYQRGRRRPIVCRLEGGLIKLRLKGTRRTYSVGVPAVWMMAARLAVETERREKKQRRLTTNA